MVIIFSLLLGSFVCYFVLSRGKYRSYRKRRPVTEITYCTWPAFDFSYPDVGKDWLTPRFRAAKPFNSSLIWLVSRPMVKNRWYVCQRSMKTPLILRGIGWHSDFRYNQLFLTRSLRQKLIVHLQMIKISGYARRSWHNTRDILSKDSLIVINLWYVHTIWYICVTTNDS